MSPLRKRLPFECGGHRKKISNKRVLLGPWRKISSSKLAIHPIHDKDSQSAKNNDKLSERHLSESVGLSALVRMIINYTILPSLNIAWLEIVYVREVLHMA